MRFIKSKFPDMQDLHIPVNEEGSAYVISWEKSMSHGDPDISNIPSREYALYLASTVQFHLGHKFHLFDEVEFKKGVDDFYADAALKVRQSRMWYVQFLVILALGKAFLVHDKDANLPPGSELFIRGMGLLPDTDQLFKEPLISIEVLCSISLYFLSLDLRNNAYGYVS